MPIEQFVNQASTTVAAAQTAVASGTVQTWTVASSTGFPAASATANQFRIMDPAAGTEIILVTAVSGTTWTVTRGAESTTPVAHTAGFTVYAILTAGALTSYVASVDQNSTLDRVFYVSKSGSDTNTGRSWGAAFLTVAAGIAALGGNDGTVNIGAGTYVEAAGITLTGAQRLVGVGMFSTIIQLNASGTLFSFINKTNSEMHDLGLKFASSSVTGTLLLLSNSFTMKFFRVRFSGTATAGQVGMKLDLNTGDCHFYDCFWSDLAVGCQNDTTVNYIIGGNVINCISGFQGGDPTGVSFGSGICITDVTFVLAGTIHIDIMGTADAWIVDRCWFDGSTTIAVRCGAAGTNRGPRLFAFTNCPSIMATTTSLILHAADRVSIDNVRFGNTGSNPVEISVPIPANVKRGKIGSYYSAQGNRIESLVPPQWDGWSGYKESADGTVQIQQFNYFTDTPNYPNTYRRVIVRIANRAVGTAAVTLTFPSAFETSFAGGQYFRTFDNTGMANTWTASAITIPTGVACASGMIIIEGW